MNSNLAFFYIAGKKKKNNMKCALCGKEIRGRDCINASIPEKEMYVHSMPCDWYDFERDTDNRA